MTPYKLIPLAIILILGACTGSAWAEDWQVGNPKPWTKNEKAMAGTFIAGQVINYFQIEYAFNNPGWYEKSWHIRKIHNEFRMEGVAIWKAGTTAIILTAANNLPKWRKKILGGANIVVWPLVIHDSIKGVGFSIKFF